MAKKEWFIPLYVLSGIWQNTGWDSIIYLAALSSISVDLYEAATVDGASKFKRMIYIRYPLHPADGDDSADYEHGQHLQPGVRKNLPDAELAEPARFRNDQRPTSTSRASSSGKYSYSAAIGLFNTVINFVILLTVNKIAGKMGDTSLF